MLIVARLPGDDGDLAVLIELDAGDLDTGRDHGLDGGAHVTLAEVGGARTSPLHRHDHGFHCRPAKALGGAGVLIPHSAKGV